MKESLTQQRVRVSWLFILQCVAAALTGELFGYFVGVSAALDFDVGIGSLILALSSILGSELLVYITLIGVIASLSTGFGAVLFSIYRRRNQAFLSAGFLAFLLTAVAWYNICSVSLSV